MPGNFISRLFRRESADKIDSADLRGPLHLGPGDQVRYYQREFEVAGVVALHQKGCVRRFRYHLVSGEGERLVLSATADPELRLPIRRTRSSPSTGGSSASRTRGSPRRRRSAFCTATSPEP